MPVTVPRCEIHPAVNAARIVPQDMLDRAQRLHELAPVHRPQGAQTADTVADRYLIGGLLLGLGLNRLLNGQTQIRKMLLDPRQRQSQRGALASQASHQFRHKSAR